MEASPGSKRERWRPCKEGVAFADISPFLPASSVDVVPPEPATS